MEPFGNAMQYIAELKKQNNKEHQSYHDLSQYLEFKAREQGVPLMGHFELTPYCNLDCKMCYVHMCPDQMQGKKVFSTE